MWMCPFPFPSQPGRRTFPSTPTCVYPRWQVLPPPFPGGCWKSPVNVHVHELLEVPSLKQPFPLSSGLLSQIFAFPSSTSCCHLLPLHFASWQPPHVRGIDPKTSQGVEKSSLQFRDQLLFQQHSEFPAPLGIAGGFSHCSLAGLQHSWEVPSSVAVLSTGVFGSPISLGTRMFYPFPTAFREYAQCFSMDFLTAFGPGCRDCSNLGFLKPEPFVVPAQSCGMVTAFPGVLTAWSREMARETWGATLKDRAGQ